MEGTYWCMTISKVYSFEFTVRLKWKSRERERERERGEIHFVIMIIESLETQNH